MNKIRMQGISKSFSGLQALNRAELELAPGRIHGLLGQNGAGKTTLMNILSGIYRADAGEIALDGRPVSIRSPRDARRAGIGMVHQHFRLIPTLTVAENIALVRSRFVLRPSALRRSTAALMDQYGFGVAPERKVADLSVGEAQKVEIAKALYSGARVLILDEPTAVLTPNETGELFSLLREMCRQGLTIVFITHKLEEVLSFADRITVMRRGRTVRSLDADQADVDLLSSLMFGRALEAWQTAAPRPSGRAPRPGLLSLEGVSLPAGPASRGLDRVSLELSRGEITGIAGVSGNGQQDLAELLIGLRRPAQGRILFDGQPVENPTPRFFLQRGMAYVPGDRLGQGLCPGLGARDNLLLKSHPDPPYTRRGILNLDRAGRDALRRLKRYGAAVRDLESPVSLLSGGNLQRLILARELLPGVQVLVAVNPSRGLDLQGITLMRRKLLEFRDRDAAIVIISEDLDELLAVSDRLHVIYRGRLSPGFDRGHQDTALIGRLMGGAGFPEACS